MKWRKEAVDLFKRSQNREDSSASLKTGLESILNTRANPPQKNPTDLPWHFAVYPCRLYRSTSSKKENIDPFLTHTHTHIPYFWANFPQFTDRSIPTAVPSCNTELLSTAYVAVQNRVHRVKEIPSYWFSMPWAPLSVGERGKKRGTWLAFSLPSLSFSAHIQQTKESRPLHSVLRRTEKGKTPPSSTLPIFCCCFPWGAPLKKK